ncbi:hypothetical protein Salat_2926000 [Sesamum alatum]|uniref:3'-5' exonuclease domain-containing protein n=1 Tax=Sesamum alatum TaxID=300844 RepID=A0AAE2C8D7_9LAMI|nr:hypothetical protein Salat_2926000 [Sesamum alatum]
MTIGIRDHDLPSNTHNTYDVFFFDDTILTTVTHDPDTVSDWISEIMYIHRRRLHSLIVGLDVEWRPSFTRHYQNPVATLQICVGRRCLIYQLIHTRYIPDSLDDFLSDDDFTFVGVGVNPDLEKLDSDYGIGGEARAVELGKRAADEYGRKELKNAGLKGLSSFVLGREMEKPRRVTTSRWDNRWLTAEQVQYACIDAFVSFEIGRILNASDY